MRYALIFCLLTASLTLSAQKYSRVKVKLDAAHSIEQLAALGVEVDHGKYQPGKYFTSEFSELELSAIKASGFNCETLVDDLVAQYHALNDADLPAEKALANCSPTLPTVYETPSHYTYGSMGGYYTYQEMLDILDQMASEYPNIFKARQPISTVNMTHEGRPVYWIKVSDNPNTDEATEPEMLYTAVHHAREPNSLSQMIFYLWYLLERYETDPEVKYLVDNIEMYFIPCINPDGYIFNETNEPNGGGFWRKNRRDNGNGTFGVDLNRNYGYSWGFDNTGSSPNPNSDTYRGTSGFSEPETQMVRDFCLAHQFQFALNYHTFSNLLIYPWGYVDGPTPDHASFSTFGPWMTRDNNYLNGFGSQTVGYTTNGGSDDWMYGEQTTKGKIFSMTPEVGPATWGFWPPESAIDGLNKDAMTLNLSAAHLVLNFGLLTPSGGLYVDSHQGEIPFSLKKIGLATGQLTVSLSPVSDNIAAIDQAISYGMLHLDEASNSFGYTLNPAIAEGDSVVFDLVLDNGLYQWHHPVVRIYSTSAGPAFVETGDNLDAWAASGSWGTTGESFKSAPSSITDSPGLDYAPNVTSDIILDNPIQVESATNVYLSYWAKWDIEEDEDYAQILLSIEGAPFQALCGKYTEAGTDQQLFDEPLYDGVQGNWVREEIDLTEWLDVDDVVDYAFAFRMVADEFIEADGFYFDDLELTVVTETTSTTYDLDTHHFKLTTRPNPASDFVLIEAEGNVPMLDMAVAVFNTNGQQVASETAHGKVVKLKTSQLQPGIYQYRTSVNGKHYGAGRFVVSR